MNENLFWTGFDLDGTLARYDGWVNHLTIGEPIPKMIARLKALLAEGKNVKIFTARVVPTMGGYSEAEARDVIQKWCLKHIGVILPITATKDGYMIALYDDRCVQVVPNTGELITEISNDGIAELCAAKNAMDNRNHELEICLKKVRDAVAGSDTYNQDIIDLIDKYTKQS